MLHSLAVVTVDHFFDLFCYFHTFFIAGVAHEQR
jgi:hypothetical protein